MDNLKALLHKYRELISYVFFGVLTTIVNYGCYLLTAPFFETTTIPTAIAWVVSVIFAYVTNRIFVFHSHARGCRALCWEILTFFGARALSGVMDVGIMWVFADHLRLNDKLVKLASNVFVVIFNYIASKLVIFRKNGKRKGTPHESV